MQLDLTIIISTVSAVAIWAFLIGPILSKRLAKGTFIEPD